MSSSVLANLPRLSQLILAGTRVTDAGLLHLRSMVGLSLIDVSYTRVTDI